MTPNPAPASPESRAAKATRFARALVQRLREQGPAGAWHVLKSRIDKLDIMQFGLRGMLLPQQVRVLNDPFADGRSADTRVTAFSVMQDAMVWLPTFLNHHREMGIERFVILDNGSGDGTREYLLTQPDVILLESLAPYCAYENTFKRHLVDRFGRDRWCLFLDADELFVYPGMEHRKVGELAERLAQQGFSAAVTQMLDLFSDRPVGARIADPQASLLEAFDHFELDSIERTPFPHSLGNTVPPELQEHWGGVRKRVFGTRNCLTKVSLFFNAAGTRPFVNWHRVANKRICGTTFALLHLPFAGDFKARAIAASDGKGRGWIVDQEYEAYADGMRSSDEVRLMSSDAVRYEGPMQLVELGFLTMTDDYRAWI